MDSSFNVFEFSLKDLAHGLQELLDYEGDVEEDFGLTFQVRTNSEQLVRS